MSIQNFIPSLWSADVLSALRANLVATGITNQNYKGEISGGGDVVKINEISEVTIRDYTSNSTSEITSEYLSDAQKELVIDNQKYFNWEIDDVDAAQAVGNVREQAMASGGHGLAQAMDDSVLALHGSAGITTSLGSTGSGINITSANVLEYVSLVSGRMDQANVPQVGRWICVPPWFAHKMQLAKIELNRAPVAADEAYARGYLGTTEYGFAVYVSSRVVNGNFTDNAKVLAGYTGSITSASQITKVQSFVSQKRFTDTVRGLFVYGVKVVRPNSLACLTADYTAEA